MDSTLLRQSLAKAAQLLPAQGPITAFVFLNSLQALEDLPFEEGLRRGKDLFGSETTLSEGRYREKLKKGRIARVDLEESLRSTLNGNSQNPVGPSGTRFDLRLAMLLHPVRTAPVAEIEWFLAETDALATYRTDDDLEIKRCVRETQDWATREHFGEQPEKFRSMWPELKHSEAWTPEDWTTFSLRALWQVCIQGVRHRPSLRAEHRSRRHRDLYLAQSGLDLDRRIQEILIPFCAAFIDQGLSTWELPNRDAGMWPAFHSLYQGATLFDPWQSRLPAELKRIGSMTSDESISESLTLLGVEDDEAVDYLTRELLALRGWAGMIWQAEDRGDRVARAMKPGTLIDYMAIRLVLMRVALSDWLGRAADCSLADVRSQWISQLPTAEPVPPQEQAFQVFQVAQMRGWSAAAMAAMSPEQWTTLLSEIEEFDSEARRKMFHTAFERRFRVQALDAISIHTRGQIARPVENPLFQSVYCIDAREESFRRHLEEVCPRAETFGAAGFFGVPMYYKGVADAHFQALCPIVVRPKVWVTEEVVYSLADFDRRNASSRRRLAKASHQIHVRSRSVAGGALITASLGVLASIPLVARVLFPRTTARLRETLNSVVAPPQVTRLRIERLTETPGKEGDSIGYSLDEMAGMCERILSETGLRSGFARLVCFFGHGSFCLNNPHKSCYDCGACSGSAGSPNARALAMMLNDPRIRKMLEDRGIHIPETTYFLGGLHNTATDEITFFDLDQLPRTHHPDFEEAREALDRACELNAQERCRRFYSAPLDIAPEDAKKHVESRAEDLAQTRPEFGNASNAMCVVGRRARTRGLYLDRRSFLVSYDASLDDEESTILGRILGAVVIVCSGINLQYYFSFVDPSGWGAGTKLPHNITSLLGVMDGASSDLRSGLPWQGVEIHEPIRLLFVIEARPSQIEKIKGRNAAVANILNNGWVQLALLDPETAEVRLYQNGEYVPYTASLSELPQRTKSHDWYEGFRDHLGFAQIVGSQAASVSGAVTT